MFSDAGNFFITVLFYRLVREITGQNPNVLSDPKKKKN